MLEKLYQRLSALNAIFLPFRSLRLVHGVTEGAFCVSAPASSELNCFHNENDWGISSSSFRLFFIVIQEI